MSQETASRRPVLKMEGISKRFGATRALADVALDVAPGEVLALIGENGAGKSTLMKILSGAHVPDSGAMELSGQRYAPRGPHAARMAGVAMIYQELNLAPHLSVEDNIMLGREEHAGGVLRRSAQRQRCRQALALLGHPNLPLATPALQLSVGMQQLVEIARALVFDAKVIVFDEPTSSLTQQDAENLFRVIRKLRESGMAVIYISHFLEEIRQIADRYTVIRDGAVVGGGQLADATENQIVALMVGRSVDELFPSVPHQPGEVILQTHAISGRRSPRDVSFDVRRGEILGIAGLVEPGARNFCAACSRSIRCAAARSASPRYCPANRRGRIAAGLGLVSEDRKGEGLAQNMSIADNMTYSRLQPYTRFGWLSLGRRRRAVEDWMGRLAVKARSAEQAVQELSGGNQQKVALARVLHQQADVLLLDEPTRGIDVGTKAEIYRLMGKLAADGKAVIFVSSYLPELLAICDRVGVMARGRLRAVRPVSEWSEESVMACAVSSDDEAT